MQTLTEPILSKPPLLWEQYLYKWKKIKPSLEEDYAKSKIPRQSSVLKLLIWISFIQAVITLALNPKERSDKVYLGLRVTEIIILALLYVVHRKKMIGCENLLLLVNTSLFLILCEYLKKNIDDGERLPCFMIGLLIELQALSMIVSKVDFLRNIIFIAVTNILCGSRYMPFNENPDSKFFPIIHVVANTILMSLMSYITEINDRMNFYSDKEKNFSLKCFKELITDVFPSPIIICHEENILFANEEAFNTLACKENFEILEKFQGIFLDSKHESLMNIFNDSLENEGKVPTIKPNLASFSRRDLMMSNGTEEEKGGLKSFKEMEKLTLYDLLKMRNKHFKAKKIFYKVFLGFHRNRSDSEMSRSYFDIKIKNIVWEEKQATMIILSENKTIQEINLLKKQSLYKDNLLATVSHDLRTPLNGIIGILSQTVETIAEAGLKKNLTIALRSAKYLLFMINDILDFHQISNGKLRLNFEYFPLWDLICEVSKLIKFQAKLKGLRFITENKLSSFNSKAYTHSDPNRLKQVILNLLGNALKFTTGGSIRISLEEFESVEEGEMTLNNADLSMEKKKKQSFENMYLIKVTDTGIGIKKEDQLKLFKLFGKIENSSNNKLNKAGIGLGLSISQNIVKILNSGMKNGEIKVLSELGKGSCFYFPVKSSFDSSEENFNLELKDPQINEIYVSKVGTLSKKNEFHKVFIKTTLSNNETAENHQIRLLIVDDDQVNLLLATSYLKNEENYKYETACNGIQALEKIKENAKEFKFFDFILMDCNMPVMDGFEATKIIRDLINNLTIPNVVIIACTANTSPSDIEVCYKSGMNGFLAKPFSKKDFISLMRRYLEPNL